LVGSGFAFIVLGNFVAIGFSDKAALRRLPGSLFGLFDTIVIVGILLASIRKATAKDAGIVPGDARDVTFVDIDNGRQEWIDLLVLVLYLVRIIIVGIGIVKDTQETESALRSSTDNNSGILESGCWSSNQFIVRYKRTKRNTCKNKMSKLRDSPFQNRASPVLLYVQFGM
jgi:hypothetical protein